MPLAPIGNLPAISSPTTGQPSIFGELVGATTPEEQRKLQLQKMQQESQIYQAADPLRKSLAAQLQMNPSLQSDPRVLQQVYQMYQGTGLPAPVQGATQTPMGGLLGKLGMQKSPQGGSVSPAALQDQSLEEWLGNDKNIALLQGIPAGPSRASLLKLAGYNLSPEQEQGINSIQYQPNYHQMEAEARQQQVGDQLLSNTQRQMQTLLDTAIRSGDLDGIKSAIGFWQRASSNPDFPQGHGNDFDSYLQAQFQHMSPIQLAHLREMGAHTADLIANSDVAQHRVGLIDAQVARDKVEMDKDQAMAAKLRSDVGVNAARVFNLDSGAARNTAQATWYKQRISSGSPMQIEEMREGARALQGEMTTTAQAINNARSNLAKVQASQAAALTPQGRQAAQEAIDYYKSLLSEHNPHSLVSQLQDDRHNLNMLLQGRVPMAGGNAPGGGVPQDPNAGAGGGVPGGGQPLKVGDTDPQSGQKIVATGTDRASGRPVGRLQNGQVIYLDQP